MNKESLLRRIVIITALFAALCGLYLLAGGECGECRSKRGAGLSAAHFIAG